MFDVNIKIISELKYFLNVCVSDPDVLDAFRCKRRAFIRNRKLSFARLVIFIAKLCKRTLSVELDHFFEDILGNCSTSCSVSAFSQQRSKLDSSFFEVWNELLYKSFYHYGQSYVKRWKGYRVIAVDGTAISLVNAPCLTSYFGGQSNQISSFTGAKTLLHYDVLNKLFIHTQLANYRTGELPMAYSSVEKLPADALAIYDRNFGNYKMVALHRWMEEERRFVIRAKEKHNFIASFIKSGRSSEEVNMYPSAEAIAGLKKNGFIVSAKTALKVRLVRVDLPNGVTEVLITNLWKDDGYGDELFKELYFMRWGVETGISTVKNLLQLESFSGLTVQSVKQDFFATIFVANLTSLLTRQAEDRIEDESSQSRPKMGRPKTRKWPQQVNRNKATGKLREMLLRLFTAEKPDEILQWLSDYFKKHLLPVRKGRTFPRRRKNKQSKSKHKTYSNYKLAA